MPPFPPAPPSLPCPFLPLKVSFPVEGEEEEEEEEEEEDSGDLPLALAPCLLLPIAIHAPPASADSPTTAPVPIKK